MDQGDGFFCGLRMSFAIQDLRRNLFFDENPFVPCLSNGVSKEILQSLAGWIDSCWRGLLSIKAMNP